MSNRYQVFLLLWFVVVGFIAYKLRLQSWAAALLGIALYIAGVVGYTYWPRK